MVESSAYFTVPDGWAGGFVGGNRYVRLIITFDVMHASRYYCFMSIRSFQNKETAAVFSGLEVRRLPKEMQVLARTKLYLIDAARTVQDLRVPPGNMLEKLLGKRKGQWSIRVNKQWRICFEFDDAAGTASNVEVCDYH